MPTRSPILARLEGLEGPRPTVVEVEGGRAESLARIVARARSLGGALALRGGAQRGDTVLIALGSGIGWIEAVLGVLFAGFVAVPLPAGVPADEIAHFASDSGARLAFATPEAAALLPPGVRVLDMSAASGGGPGAQPADVGPADVALMLYTSGTTGKPKGVLITHDNLAAQTEALREAWAFSSTDVLCHALPLHHLHGIVVALLTALTTPCSVRMLRRFDAVRVAHDLEAATVFMGVPTMYQRLVDLTSGPDGAAAAALARGARNLRLATCGSAALPVPQAEAWRSLAGTIPLERYGMTEIGIALSNPLEPSARRAGTVGTPLPGVEVRIAEGELLVRGRTVFAGYHGRPEETAAAFSDRWFRTGDVAELTQDGFYRLLGRKSVDILKTGGEKVSALEIEDALRGHPAVAEVAVVGLPDLQWGQRVVAAVVLASGIDPMEIRAWAKTRLAPYKVPREVVQVEALPRNAMGKVEKAVLARRLGGPAT